MASRDYYTSSHAPANPYSDNTYDHQTNSSYLEPTSHPERKRPYYTQQSSSLYTSATGRSDDVENYDERDAIPLDGRRKHESMTSVAPILVATPADDDPFVRDTKPGDRRPRREPREKGWFKGKVTWACYILTFAQLVVFIAEIVKNAILTSTPIQLQPSFNPMIGPSPYVLINMGARYVPCMHNMPNVQNATVMIAWPCPNATATSGASISCSLSDLCGNGGVPDPHPYGSITDQPAPNQWWRFIVPIFLHAGIIHIGFNLLLQMTLGREIEQLIGTLRFVIVYFAAGIFGFVLGGNFAASGIASTGCSGSLFGILALTLLDLLYTWKARQSPIKDLLFIVVDVAIAFVLGLLPGLDNFSHIGGFLMGLVLGVCILRSPASFSKRASQLYTQPSRVNDRDQGFTGFFRQPLGFFKDRRPIWWAWWAIRAAALFGVLIGFVLLLQNFYVWGTTCSWCKYLSCLPVTVGGQNWCDVGNLKFSNNTSSKRDLFGRAMLGDFL
ncbi:hypothetical protein AMS68_001200 [Peltaster fructicola]|uniref:Rhomboid-type serine protease n=1 Tax=Peltaster fructicola TaxID=286661 RepID=A0A6H0XLT9_9PEZI|nr:hypothetical protein AMS68_001200 [Peltaster fructicola]